MTDAPERIWIDTYAGKKDAGYWHKKNDVMNGTEYTRADLSDAALMQERCAAVCRDQWVIIPEPGTARDCYDAIRALPAITAADRLAAPLQVPEIAALVHALAVWDAAHRTGRNEPLHMAFELGQAALAALTPNEAVS